MTKFAEFILTTFTGRLVLFAILAATLILYANTAKAAEQPRCLIIGDSIAVGTKMFAPKDCVSYSKGGWNTWSLYCWRLWSLNWWNFISILCDCRSRCWRIHRRTWRRLIYRG